jgi:hypothetical protein
MTRGAIGTSQVFKILTAAIVQDPVINTANFTLKEYEYILFALAQQRTKFHRVRISLLS